MMSFGRLTKTVVSMLTFILKNMSMERGNELKVGSVRTLFFLHPNDNIVASKITSVIAKL